MGFLKKKKKKSTSEISKEITDLENLNLDDDKKEDSLPEENDNKEIEQPKKYVPSVDLSPHISQINSVVADVERLKAQTEANNELRQLFSEKFTRIDEEVGELRSMLVDREKDMQSIEVKATKAADLVSEVQPEKLMIEVKRQDARIEGLKSKLESYEQLNDSIMQELKSVRNNIRTFRGVKEIEKMTKDLLEDQTVIKKIEGKIEQHSDKVETIFMEFNHKYEEFRQFRKVVEDLNGSFASITSEFENLKVKFSGLATKDDFDKFKTVTEKVISPLKTDEDKFEDFLNEFMHLKKEVIPILSHYRDIEKAKKEELNDFSRFKDMLELKLDQKLKNTEKMVIDLHAKSDINQHEVYDTLNAVKESVSQQLKNIESTADNLVTIEDMKRLLNQEINDKIKANHTEIAEVKETINKLAVVIQKLLIALKNK